MSCAGNELRKQVTEGEEEPLELRRKKEQGEEKALGGEGGERHKCAPWGEPHWSLSREGQGRISVEYSSAFQMCPLRAWSPLTGHC